MVWAQQDWHEWQVQSLFDQCNQSNYVSEHVAVHAKMPVAVATMYNIRIVLQLSGAQLLVVIVMAARTLSGCLIGGSTWQYQI